MSLEKDIKGIMEQDIFRPVSPEDKQAREAEWSKMWEERLEEIDIVRTLIEENEFKEGGFTDAQWEKIVREWLKQNKDKTFGDLEDYSHEIQGLMMSFSDALVALDDKGIKI
jgi:hypothetical protein